MENTFDINSFDKDRTGAPASFRQCQAIGYKFAKKVKLCFGSFKSDMNVVSRSKKDHSPKPSRNLKKLRV